MINHTVYFPWVFLVTIMTPKWPAGTKSLHTALPSLPVLGGRWHPAALPRLKQCRAPDHFTTRLISLPPPASSPPAHTQAPPVVFSCLRWKAINVSYSANWLASSWGFNHPEPTCGAPDGSAPRQDYNTSDISSWVICRWMTAVCKRRQSGQIEWINAKSVYTEIK